jgi:hypothetical protein
MPTIQSLSSDVADSLAPGIGEASMTGSLWSDFSEDFPGLGFGFTLGAVFLPTDALGVLLRELGNDIPGEIDQIGAPIPAIVGNARLTTPVIPIQLGLRYGWLPTEVIAGFFKNEVTLDYYLLGLDADYALLEQEGLIPTVSVGASYSFYHSFLQGPFGSTLIFTDVPYGSSGTSDLQIVDPDMGYAWDSHGYSIRSQATWELGIISLFSTLSSTWSNTMLDSYITSAQDISLSAVPGLKGQAAVDAIEEGLARVDGSFPFFNPKGIELKDDAIGWSPTLTAGLVLNLGPGRIIFSGGYNFTTTKVKVEISTRVQL